MTNYAFSRRRLLALSGSAFVLSSTELVRAGSDALAVVVAARSTQRTLSLDALRRIFLNKDTNSESGDRFVPINQRSSSRDRLRFDARVLSMTPDQVARYWIDQRLRGKRVPATVSSLPMLKRALAELPGAISYLALSDVDSSLRALSIDGKQPNDDRYALR